MLTLYLRKERRNGRAVTVYYRDADATIQACVNPWPSRPDRRFRYVWFNCFRYAAKWLDDLPCST